jgi:DNA-binding transcriptional ArsR family regulator
MARLLPIQSETEVPDSGPRVVDLEGEDADAVFSALSSDTARDIYRSLQEEPHTPSEVAEAADTSIQNVRYHLDNLEDAGLIEVVDTWYSSRGNEMSVYAPTSDALVLASGEEQTSRLKTALSRLVSGVVVLALASLAFQRAARSFVGGKIGLGRGNPQGSGAAEEPGSYEFATDGGDGGGVAGGDGGGGGAGGGTGGANGSERAAADGTPTDSGDLNVMSGDSTTATPADTQTATEATPQPTAEPTQAATTVAEEPTAEATRTATEAGTGTQTPMATGTPTAEPATTAEPETTRTVVESAANTTLDQTVRETTTAMTSDPTVTTTVADAARTGNDALQAGGLPPGLVFFAGGAIVLVAVVGYLYWKGA